MERSPADPLPEGWERRKNERAWPEDARPRRWEGSNEVQYETYRGGVLISKNPASIEERMLKIACGEAKPPSGGRGLKKVRGNGGGKEKDLSRRIWGKKTRWNPWGGGEKDNWGSCASRLRTITGKNKDQSRGLIRSIAKCVRWGKRRALGRLPGNGKRIKGFRSGWRQKACLKAAGSSFRKDERFAPA